MDCRNDFVREIPYEKCYSSNADDSIQLDLDSESQDLQDLHKNTADLEYNFAVVMGPMDLFKGPGSYDYRPQPGVYAKSPITRGLDVAERYDVVMRRTDVCCFLDPEQSAQVLTDLDLLPEWTWRKELKESERKYVC